MEINYGISASRIEARAGMEPAVGGPTLSLVSGTFSAYDIPTHPLESKMSSASGLRKELASHQVSVC